MSRPRIEFDSKDWDRISAMCEISCTKDEIADVMGCSEDTLTRRCEEVHGVSFADFYKRHLGRGKTSLRRLQYKSAQKGNVSMQIWLGKQWLGQRDNHDVDVSITRFEFQDDD